MLVIDLEECIDCRLCVPPVSTCKRPIAGNNEWVKTKVKAHLFDPESVH